MLYPKSFFFFHSPSRCSSHLSVSLKSNLVSDLDIGYAEMDPDALMVWSKYGQLFSSDSEQGNKNTAPFQRLQLQLYYT